MTSPASPHGDDVAQGEIAPGFRDECVQFFGDLASVFGFGKSVGQIYGLLFASPQALSFTDIADALDISRGSTSQGIAFLRELGAIRAVQLHSASEIEDRRSDAARQCEDGRIEGAALERSERVTGAGCPSGGDGNKSKTDASARGAAQRRELFVPELQLRKLISGVLKERVDPVVTGGAVRLKTLREHAKAAPTKSGQQFSAERLKKLESWRRQMGLLLPVLKTILGPGRA